MMSRIDRIRRTHLLQRPAAADGDEGPDQSFAAQSEPARSETARPARTPRAAAGDAAAFAAQLIGQDGQKRGLRAGPQAIDVARGAYNRVEWSGSKDRRRTPRNKTKI